MSFRDLAKFSAGNVELGCSREVVDLLGPFVRI
jgi:hypothetical protein